MTSTLHLIFLFPIRPGDLPFSVAERLWLLTSHQGSVPPFFPK